MAIVEDMVTALVEDTSKYISHFLFYTKKSEKNYNANSIPKAVHTILIDEEVNLFIKVWNHILMTVMKSIENSSCVFANGLMPIGR